jgi:hypothetical protein
MRYPQVRVPEARAALRALAERIERGAISQADTAVELRRLAGGMYRSDRGKQHVRRQPVALRPSILTRILRLAA